MIHRPVFSIAPVEALFPEPEDPRPEEIRMILAQGAAVLSISGTTPSTVVFPVPLPAGLSSGPPVYLGRQDGVLYYAAGIGAGAPLPEGLSLAPVREYSGRIPDPELALAAYAVRILEFDRSSRFCGRCGGRTQPLRTERARRCPDCNRTTYPRLSPAIIVLVARGDEVLLASSPRFPQKIFSILAGFVEPGENLEEAVHREVREEVGITVRNLRYFASEPWPFPDSLMIGFVAEYAGGDLVLDPAEIESAGWFTRDALPPLPSGLSISRALIDAWVRREI